MSKLFDAMNEEAFTENGARQYKHTGNACLDFFTKVGSLRGQTEEAYRLFKLAYLEDREVALRILLWAHDCRGGAGEREVFIKIFTQALVDGLIEKGRPILKLIPELGRWDTITKIMSCKELKDHPIQEQCLFMIQMALQEDNALCAKWMPRQGLIAERIRGWLNRYRTSRHMPQLSRKDYRKMLVELCKVGNVVEQKMSARDWDNIEFGKVPSVAATRYAAAFSRHTENYAQYLADVKSGKATMHMSAAFPHELVRMLLSRRRDQSVVDAVNLAYEEMTKKFNINRNVLVMADVSGSMYTPVSGSIQAIDVAVSTAICVADHNTGIFKNTVLTFSDNVEMVTLDGTFAQKYGCLINTQDPYGTDFEKAYMTILAAAKRHHLSNEDMPETLLVITDMEFNMPSFDDVHIEIIRKQYEEAGYTVPKIVFWNLNQRSLGYALTKLSKNCAMISGFSLAILNTVFSDDEIDPITVMMKTVMVPRYNLSYDNFSQVAD